MSHCNDARSPHAFDPVDPDRDWCPQYEQRKAKAMTPEIERCQFCGETGNPCACGVPLHSPPSIAVLASAPAYPDCAVRAGDCACLRQGYPKDDGGTGCVLSRTDAKWSEAIATVINAEIERTSAGEPSRVRPLAAYPDCALRDDCACLRRGYPNPRRTGCLVPSINAEARELGWEEPYPAPGSDAAKFRNLLADLETALREGRDAALAGDLPAAQAAMRRSADYLAILRRRELERQSRSADAN